MKKPYKRIVRPLVNNNAYNDPYLSHSSYCSESRSLIHAYHILQNDFKKLFDYIELCDDNKRVYSHRIYEMLLRTCTEFENNCKGILLDNGYTKEGNLKIHDYFKIKAASKLDEYEIKINVWSPESKIIKPFEGWDWNQLEKKPKPLSWYQAYNRVKHNRSSNFKEASLENLLRAIGGLFVILASQFGMLAFDPYNNQSIVLVDGDFKYVSGGLFSIKFPNWNEEELLKFDWNTIRDEPEPFRQFDFNA